LETTKLGNFARSKYTQTVNLWGTGTGAVLVWKMHLGNLAMALALASARGGDLLSHWIASVVLEFS
jgi:hypothetical protein